MFTHRMAYCHGLRQVFAGCLALAWLGVWNGLGDAYLQAAEPSLKTQVSGNAAALYGPTLEASEIPAWIPSAEPSGGCQAVSLYQPALEDAFTTSSARPPKKHGAAGGLSLYAPSLPSRILPECSAAGACREAGTCPTGSLYAPSLGAENETAEGFGGLVDAAYWDEGIGDRNIRERRFMRIRHSMYMSDDDLLGMLYDVKPTSTKEEPPRELSKVMLPLYRIEAPDVLVIEAIKLVPRAPYRIGLYDTLQISVGGTIPSQPINGYFLVEDDGLVNLGPSYEPMRIAGMTIEEASAEITQQLKRVLQRPSVSVQLIRLAGFQQLSGIRPVQPDGRINLGNCGMVHVAGKTVSEARAAIEKHIAEYYDSPEITVDVISYNSKNYFIVIAGAEAGESVLKLPITGNETVLDALSNIHGLPRVSSTTMWVARPAPNSMACEQVFPVDYLAITRGGVTDTNYQLMPGDRLYIVDDRLMASDRFISEFTSPIQRMLNISRLGASTVRGYQIMGRGYNQFRRGL